MTELRNRDQHEAEIAEAAAQILDEYFGKLQDELGNEPPRAGVDEGFWAALTLALTSALQPKLEATYLDMLIDIAFETGVELEDAAITAAEWARSYTIDLVKGITDNRRVLLQGAISDFYDKGLSLGDLYTRLAPEFGMPRAVSIGITETTRAASAAQLAFGVYLRARGQKVVEIWNTSNDERTCPQCSPLEGKRQGDGWTYPPPAHPRCRCWLTTVPESELS